MTLSLQVIPESKIPDDILKDSLLAHLAAAYFAVSKQMERKTGCSATRGFILSILRHEAALNQNQIATRLGFDRTVVHRAIKTMIKEGLVSERKAKTGRALLLHLTPRGEKYHQALVQHRRSADEKIRLAFTAEERATLIQRLKTIAEMEF
ncbi:MAG TPA: MarR family transcriptional regulator [Candidatus Solibacter sp.]|nr:MarR family transcriptional regulator [Candidatus Solibacter sp.]